MSIEAIIQQAVEQAVKSAIQEVLKNNNKKLFDDDILLSAKETAKILGINYNELLIKKDILGLNFTQIGSSYMFSKKLLFKWIEESCSAKKVFKTSV